MGFYRERIFPRIPTSMHYARARLRWSGTATLVGRDIVSKKFRLPS